MERSEDVYKDGSLKEELLTPEEERDLARKAKAGDRLAFDQFYRANLRLVANKAGTLHRKMPWVPESDLIQDGNLGLLGAVKGYNPEKGFRFSTYAVPIIMRRMASGVSERTGAIYIPEEVQKARAKLKNGRYQFFGEFGYNPTHFELCEYLGIGPNMAKTLEKLVSSVSMEAMRQSRRSSSLLNRVRDHSSPDPCRATLETMTNEQLHGMIQRLDNQKRDILFRRFSFIDGKPEPLGSIGKTWRLTRERIRQLQNEAIQELREYAGALQEACLL